MNLWRNKNTEIYKIKSILLFINILYALQHFTKMIITLYNWKPPYTKQLNFNGLNSNLINTFKN